MSGADNPEDDLDFNVVIEEEPAIDHHEIKEYFLKPVQKSFKDLACGCEKEILDQNSNISFEWKEGVEVEDQNSDAENTNDCYDDMDTDVANYAQKIIQDASKIILDDSFGHPEFSSTRYESLSQIDKDFHIPEDEDDSTTDLNTSLLSNAEDGQEVLSRRSTVTLEEGVKSESITIRPLTIFNELDEKRKKLLHSLDPNDDPQDNGDQREGRRSRMSFFSETGGGGHIGDLDLDLLASNNPQLEQLENVEVSIKCEISTVLTRFGLSALTDLVAKNNEQMLHDTVSQISEAMKNMERSHSRQIELLSQKHQDEMEALSRSFQLNNTTNYNDNNSNNNNNNGDDSNTSLIDHNRQENTKEVVDHWEEIGLLKENCDEELNVLLEKLEVSNVEVEEKRIQLESMKMRELQLKTDLNKSLEEIQALKNFRDPTALSRPGSSPFLPPNQHCACCLAKNDTISNQIKIIEDLKEKLRALAEGEVKSLIIPEENHRDELSRLNRLLEEKSAEIRILRLTIDELNSKLDTASSAVDNLMAYERYLSDIDEAGTDDGDGDEEGCCGLEERYLCSTEEIEVNGVGDHDDDAGDSDSEHKNDDDVNQAEMRPEDELKLIDFCDNGEDEDDKHEEKKESNLKSDRLDEPHHCDGDKVSGEGAVVVDLSLDFHDVHKNVEDENHEDENDSEDGMENDGDEDVESSESEDVDDVIQESPDQVETARMARESDKSLGNSNGHRYDEALNVESSSGTDDYDDDIIIAGGGDIYVQQDQDDGDKFLDEIFTNDTEEEVKYEGNNFPVSSDSKKRITFVDTVTRLLFDCIDGDDFNYLHLELDLIREIIARIIREFKQPETRQISDEENVETEQLGVASCGVNVLPGVVPGDVDVLQGIPHQDAEMPQSQVRKNSTLMDLRIEIAGLKDAVGREERQQKAIEYLEEELKNLKSTFDDRLNAEVEEIAQRIRAEKEMKMGVLHQGLRAAEEQVQSNNEELMNFGDGGGQDSLVENAELRHPALPLGAEIYQSLIQEKDNEIRMYSERIKQMEEEASGGSLPSILQELKMVKDEKQKIDCGYFQLMAVLTEVTSVNVETEKKLRQFLDFFVESAAFNDDTNMNIDPDLISLRNSLADVQLLENDSPRPSMVDNHSEVPNNITNVTAAGFLRGSYSPPDMKGDDDDDYEMVLTDTAIKVGKSVVLLMDYVKQYQSKNRFLRQQMSDVQENIKVLTARETELHEQLDRELTDRRDVDLKLLEANQLLAGLNQRNQTLEEQVRTMEDDRYQLMRKLEHATNELQGHKLREEEVKFKEGQIDQQRQLILESGIDETIQELLKENTALAEECRGMNQKMQKDRQKFEEQLKELEASNEQLDQQIKELKEKKETAEKDAELRIDKLERQLKSQKKFSEDQTSEREQEREESQETIGKLESMIRENEKIHNALPRLEAEIHDLEEQLKDKMDSCSILQAAKERLEDDKEKQDAIIGDLNEMIRSLECEMEAKFEKEADLLKKLEKATEELEQLQSEVNNSTNRDKREKEMEVMTEELRMNKRALIDLKEDLGESNKSKQALETKNKELEQKLKEAMSQKDNLEKQICEVEQESDNQLMLMTKKQEAADKKFSQQCLLLEQSSKELQDLRKVIDELTAENDRYKKEILVVKSNSAAQYLATPEKGRDSSKMSNVQDLHQELSESLQVSDVKDINTSIIHDDEDNDVAEDHSHDSDDIPANDKVQPKKVSFTNAVGLSSEELLCVLPEETGSDLVDALDQGGEEKRQLLEEVGRLEERLKSNSAEMEVLKENLIAKEKSLNELRRSLECQSAETTCLQQIIEKKDFQVVDMQKKLDDTHEKLTAKNHELLAVSSTVIQLTNEVKGLRVENEHHSMRIADLEKSSSQAEAFRQEAEELGQKVENLTQEAEALRQRAMSLSQVNETLKQEAEVLKLELAASNQAVEMLKDESETLKSDVDYQSKRRMESQTMLEREIEKLKSSVNIKSNELAEIKARLDKVVDDSRQQVEALKLESKSLIQEVDTSMQEAEALRKAAQSSRQEADNFRLELAASRKEVEILRGNAEKLRKDLNSQIQVKTECQATLEHDLEKLKDEVITKNAELTRVTAELDRTIESSGFQAESSRLEAETLRQEVEVLRRNLEASDRSAKELKSEIERFNCRSESGQQTQAELLQKIEEMSEMIDIKDKELAKLKTSLEDSKKKYTELFVNQEKLKSEHTTDMRAMKLSHAETVEELKANYEREIERLANDNCLTTLTRTRGDGDVAGTNVTEVQPTHDITMFDETLSDDLQMILRKLHQEAMKVLTMSDFKYLEDLEKNMAEMDRLKEEWLREKQELIQVINELKLKLDNFQATSSLEKGCVLELQKVAEAERIKVDRLNEEKGNLERMLSTLRRDLNRIETEKKTEKFEQTGLYEDFFSEQNVLKKKLGQLQATVDEEKAKNQSMQENMTRVKSTLSEVEAQKRELERELLINKHELRTTSSQNDLLQSDLQDIKVKLNAVQKKIQKEEDKRSGSTNRPHASTSALSAVNDSILMQNAQLMQTMREMAEEKKELKLAIERLEKQAAYDKLESQAAVDKLERQATAEEQKWEQIMSSERAKLMEVNRVLQQQLTDLRREMDRRRDVSTSNEVDREKIQKLYAKYLKAESFKKSLIYQKKYLIYLLGGFQENEQATLAAIAQITTNVRLQGVYDLPDERREMYGSNFGRNLDGVGSGLFTVLSPRKKFKGAAMVIVAIARLKFLVKKWQRVSRATPLVTPSSSSVRAARSPLPSLQTESRTYHRNHLPSTTHANIKGVRSGPELGIIDPVNISNRNRDNQALHPPQASSSFFTLGMVGQTAVGGARPKISNFEFTPPTKDRAWLENQDDSHKRSSGFNPVRISRGAEEDGTTESHGSEFFRNFRRDMKVIQEQLKERPAYDKMNP